MSLHFGTSAKQHQPPVSNVDHDQATTMVERIIATSRFLWMYRATTCQEVPGVPGVPGGPWSRQLEIPPIPPKGLGESLILPAVTDEVVELADLE